MPSTELALSTLLTSTPTLVRISPASLARGSTLSRMPNCLNTTLSAPSWILHGNRHLTAHDEVRVPAADKSQMSALASNRASPRFMSRWMTESRLDVDIHTVVGAEHRTQRRHRPNRRRYRAAPIYELLMSFALDENRGLGFQRRRRCRDRINDAASTCTR